MQDCWTYLADGHSPYPVALPHLPEGDASTLACDFTRWFDCEGTGVSLVSVTWAKHATDDPGAELVLTPLGESGMVSRVLISAGADLAGTSYRISARGVASDGQDHTRWFEIPVVDTSLLSYAA